MITCRKVSVCLLFNLCLWVQSAITCVILSCQSEDTFYLITLFGWVSTATLELGQQQSSSPTHRLIFILVIIYFVFFYSSGVSLISTSSFNLMLVLNFRPPDIQNRHVTRHNRQEVGDPRTSWQNSPQSAQFISLSMYYLFPVSAVSSSMSIGRQTGW